MSKIIYNFLNADKHNYPFTFSQLQAEYGTVPRMSATPDNVLLIHEQVANIAETLSMFFSIRKFGFLDLMENMGTLKSSSGPISFFTSDDTFIDQMSDLRKSTANDNRHGFTKVA